jgi:hypothetical protein
LNNILKNKKMGLIKEPKNVDFYVIDKPWTPGEKKEFSELIKKLKSRSKAKR